MDLSEYGPGCGTAGDYGRTLTATVTLQTTRSTTRNHQPTRQPSRGRAEPGRGITRVPHRALARGGPRAILSFHLAKHRGHGLAKSAKNTTPPTRSCECFAARCFYLAICQAPRPVRTRRNTRRGRAGLGLRVLTAATAPA